MDVIDRRGRLDEEPFSYRVSKDRRVFLYWDGRLVETLRGLPAEKFLASIAAADVRQAQLLMARATGHFKHGNEKK